MWKCLRAVFVFAVFGALTQGLSRPVPPETRGRGISLYFLQPQRAFGNKESIRLHVEISNESGQTLLICRDIGYTSYFCFWEFEAQNASGHSMPTWKSVGDRVVGSPEAFPNALISNWIALAPHYTYGTDIDLGRALGPNPQPGRYKVRASLSSDGPATASIYNDLVHYPEVLAGLPYPGWKGKAESNWVSVEIVAKTQDR